MKIKFTLVMTCLLGLLSTATASEVQETFTTESMTNLVATVKEKVLAAVDSKDEAKYRLVVIKIDKFVSTVAMEQSFPDGNKKAEIRNILVQLAPIAHTVAQKFEDVIDWVYGNTRDEHPDENSSSSDCFY